MKAISHSTTGRYAAGMVSQDLTVRRSSDGTTTINQATIKILVADVDQGSEKIVAAASQSDAIERREARTTSE
jgi:hypothetical protein